MPSSDRWKEISSLYAAALALPEAERDAFVASTCAGDEELARQVGSLLALHDEAQQTLTAPAAEILGRALAVERASLVGRELGAYRIDAPLGSGGMGEVYRATDTRLKRAVAVKILPPDVRSDPALRQRFEREAQAIAALRHPHICVLHDVGQADGIDFLIMELLDGETLAARLERGPLPVAEAVRRGVEIADALVAIHRLGMVHRDLKPGNVMLTDSGAQLLDFGLAKVRDGAAAGLGGEPGASPAVLSMGSSTAAGTLPYMTPEQLDRGAVDHRSDIFAFGTLLYEMVTGRKAFDGDSREAIAAAIRQRPPEPLPASIRTAAPGLQALIEKCLRKRPHDRWQDAAALARALQDVEAALRTGRRPWPLPRVAAASLAVIALTAFLGWLTWSLNSARSPVEPLTLGAALPLAATEQFEMDPAWSPQGLIAYAAGRGTDFRIVIRDLATDRTLPGPPPSGTGQFQPRWSPDGDRLLYITIEGVFVWRQGTGASRQIASPGDVAGTFSATRGPAIITGAAWSPDGREIAVAWGGALHAVDVESGRRRHLVTTPEELHWCDWSPRGTWIACTAGNHHLPFYAVNVGNIAPSALVVIPRSGGRAIEVAPKTSSNQSPVWSGDERHLFFVSNRQGPSDIYAIAIGQHGAPTGDPVRLTTGLRAASIAISGSGTKLAYAEVTARANLWSLPIPPPGGRVDQASARQVTFGNQVIEAMHVTRDGKWIVYDSDATGNSEIYRKLLAGGEPEQLTNHPAGDFGPEVSADGRWLAYFSWRTGSRDIFVQPFDGGPWEQVTSTPGHESYPRWMPGGSLLFVDQAFENDVGRGFFVTRRGPDGTWSPPKPLIPDAFGASVMSDGSIVYNHKGEAYIRRPSAAESVLLYRRPDASFPYAGAFLVVDDDEQWIYTKVNDDSGRASIYRMPITGGPLTEVVRFDDLARPSSRFEFAVGAGRFFFTLEDRRSNIFIADVAEIDTGRE